MRVLMFHTCTIVGDLFHSKWCNFTLLKLMKCHSHNQYSTEMCIRGPQSLWYMHKMSLRPFNLTDSALSQALYHAVGFHAHFSRREYHSRTQLKMFYKLWYAKEFHIPIACLIMYLVTPFPSRKTSEQASCWWSFSPCSIFTIHSTCSMQCVKPYFTTTSFYVERKVGTPHTPVSPASMEIQVGTARGAGNLWTVVSQMRPKKPTVSSSSLKPAKCDV